YERPATRPGSRGCGRWGRGPRPAQRPAEGSGRAVPPRVTLISIMSWRPKGPGLSLQVPVSSEKGRASAFFSIRPATPARDRSTEHDKARPVARCLHDGPAAYSSLEVLRDGSLKCLSERGEKSPDQTITFARFSRAWLGEK